MHYMKWTEIMLPLISMEFEVIWILLLLFYFHYHCELVKG